MISFMIRYPFREIKNEKFKVAAIKTKINSHIKTTYMNMTCPFHIFSHLLFVYMLLTFLYFAFYSYQCLSLEFVDDVCGYQRYIYPMGCPCRLITYLGIMLYPNG